MRYPDQGLSIHQYPFEFAPGASDRTAPSSGEQIDRYLGFITSAPDLRPEGWAFWTMDTWEVDPNALCRNLESGKSKAYCCAPV